MRTTVVVRERCGTRRVIGARRPIIVAAARAGPLRYLRACARRAPARPPRSPRSRARRTPCSRPSSPSAVRTPPPIAAEAAEPIDEILRIIDAGGKRIRPAFCFWGFRAAGGEAGEPIWRAAAALELLHTMALDPRRRDRRGRGPARVSPRSTGTPPSAPRRAVARMPRGWGRQSRSSPGDLAAAFAEELFTAAGVPRRPAGRRRARALHRMRASSRSGAYLDLVGADVDPATDAARPEGRGVHGGVAAADRRGPRRFVARARRGPRARTAEPLGQAFQLLRRPRRR